MSINYQEGSNLYSYDSVGSPGVGNRGRGVEVHPTHSGVSELTDHGRPHGLVSGTERGASGREVEPYYDMVRNPGNDGSIPVGATR